MYVAAPERQIPQDVDEGEMEADMAEGNMTGLSVAAMMGRAPTLAESHLILESRSNGSGRFRGEASARR